MLTEALHDAAREADSGRVWQFESRCEVWGATDWQRIEMRHACMHARFAVSGLMRRAIHSCAHACMMNVFFVALTYSPAVACAFRFRHWAAPGACA